MTYRKKLIEVALPLEAINSASASEKKNPFLQGHPRLVHHWWARRPLAACRAVLFASLVDDPSAHPDQFATEATQDKERQRLFAIIEDLVKWENVDNERVLKAARAEILKSTDGNPPPVLDPFCGGGSIPLEAQRLGLKAYACDLNPVAVMITKALIEIPPRFAGRPPVNPKARKKMVNASEWRGAAGLADDVRYYSKWMSDEAKKRIGHFYPKAKLSKEYGGGEVPVIAWLWARTVKCPNPACGATMPLIRSFALSTKEGKKAWVEPVINKRQKTVQFEVKTGRGTAPEGTVNRRGARCIVCNQAVPFDYIRTEGKAGRMSVQLMAIVTEGGHSRLYISPSAEHEIIAKRAKPIWEPDTELPERALSFRVQLYGMTKHKDLFTPRQILALTTLADLVKDVRTIIKNDAAASGIKNDDVPLNEGGENTTAYADGVATYLALAIDKASPYWCALSTWHTSGEQMQGVFGRQSLPMVWDFAECNPFGSVMSFERTATSVSSVLNDSVLNVVGRAFQHDSAAVLDIGERPMVATDPPYYSNIGYADLSDFFYVWLRYSLGSMYPDLFKTVLVPKAQELVATPFRFGGDLEQAKKFFEEGLGKAFSWIHDIQYAGSPITIFYAFKQSEQEETEEEENETASTGWETMLQGLLNSKMEITGTWPMRTEGEARALTRGGTNALASSIVLVCRPRAENAPLATRREFIGALRRELPDALKKLQQGNVAPVDFAQAAIGPGMSVYSRYSKILEADGSAMRVRAALQLINQELEAYFAEQEGDLDADTRFCVSWFEQKGMDEGAFGEADVLARAKNTSVQGLVDAGVLKAKSGKVRLLKRDELDDDWNPIKDARITVWECAQYLIRALHTGGEDAAGKLAAQLGGGRSEDARALAYRLYAICERKGWSQEALAYNTIVASWGEVQAKTAQESKLEQGKLI